MYLLPIIPFQVRNHSFLSNIAASNSEVMLRVEFIHTSCFQVKVDMGEPILSGPDIPTKLLATKNKAVVQAELDVEGRTWHATCVSMGNPHCVTFGAKDLKVINLQIHTLFM